MFELEWKALQGSELKYQRYFHPGRNLSFVVATGGSEDSAGIEVLSCCIAADDFKPLRVGRVGKIGGRATVLGRIYDFLEV